MHQSIGSVYTRITNPRDETIQANGLEHNTNSCNWNNACYAITFCNSYHGMNEFDTIKSLNEVPGGSLCTNIVISNDINCLYSVL